MPSDLDKVVMKNAGPTLKAVGKIATTPTVRIQEGNKFYNMLASQMVSPNHIALNHSQDVDIIIPPQRAIALDDLESARNLEFIYETGGEYVKIHRRPKVRFSVSNADTGAQQPLPVQMWADVEVYFDKQTTPAYSYQAISAYQYQCNELTSDDVGPKATVSAMNTTYGNYGPATALAASASTSYYLEIHGPWDFEALPNVVFQEMKIKVKLLGLAAILVSTGSNTGVYQLTDANLYIPHLKLTESEAIEFKNRFVNEKGLTIQFVADIQEQQSKTLSNSTSYNLDLGVEGQCVELVMMWRTSLLASGNGAISPVALVDNIDLMDSKNQSLTANNPYVGSYLLNVHSSENYGNALCFNKPFYIIPFIPGGVKAVRQAHGARLGGWYIRENDRIKLTTNTLAGGSTYYMDVIARCYHTITFSQGRPPIVHRS